MKSKLNLHKYAHIYILTNKYKTVLYIGVTTQIRQRIADHKAGKGSAFTSKYHVNQLVYVEGFGQITDAIRRERRLKKWKRDWKIKLIDEFNPDWVDLGEFL